MVCTLLNQCNTYCANALVEMRQLLMIVLARFVKAEAVAVSVSAHMTYVSMVAPGPAK